MSARGPRDHEQRREADRGAPATPGARALGAMADAARRAREAATAPPAGTPAEPAGSDPGARDRPDSGPAADSAREPAWIDHVLAQREPELPMGALVFPHTTPAPDTPAPMTPAPLADPPPDVRLRAAVAVVAAVVVAAGIALGVAEAVRHPAPAAKALHAPSTHTPVAHAITRPAHHHVTSTTATQTAASPGGPPVLSSLTPASGGAGTQIQVSGSGFMSANGLILGHFGNQVAPTSCPSETTCTLTVPDLGSAHSEEVTITTQSGTSNALTFRYD